MADIKFVNGLALDALDITKESILYICECKTASIAEVFVGNAKHSCPIHVLTNIKAINARIGHECVVENKFEC